MADSSKDWSVILDDVSFSYLVELSQNLSKVEGLVKKLVKGEYQQWNDKNSKMNQNSQNHTNAENSAWGDWHDNSKSEYANNNIWSDWGPTGGDQASNDNYNNNKSENTIRWDDEWNAKPDWSNNTSKSETPNNWDTPNESGWDKGFWESGWEKSDSKESRQEQADWGTFELSGW
uniref:Uncharacterized protein n=1 Tax=Opuntia streptacantha TaxID=393608 RepID=A0A7C8ZQM7_OPUST